MLPIDGYGLSLLAFSLYLAVLYSDVSFAIT
jgi:hypothetical protein